MVCYTEVFEAICLADSEKSSTAGLLNLIFYKDEIHRSKLRITGNFSRQIKTIILNDPK